MIYTTVDNPIYYFTGSSYIIYLHVYTKGIALYGAPSPGYRDIESWNTVAINYTINMFEIGTNNLLFTSDIRNKRKTVYEGGTDFHESITLYNQPSSMIGTIYGAIDDSPSGSNGKNEYNNEHLGPGQWISPSCN